MDDFSLLGDIMDKKFERGARYKVINLRFNIIKQNVTDKNDAFAKVGDIIIIDGYFTSPVPNFKYLTTNHDGLKYFATCLADQLEYLDNAMKIPIPGESWKVLRNNCGAEHPRSGHDLKPGDIIKVLRYEDNNTFHGKPVIIYELLNGNNLAYDTNYIPLQDCEFIETLHEIICSCNNQELFWGQFHRDCEFHRDKITPSDKR